MRRYCVLFAASVVLLSMVGCVTLGTRTLPESISSIYIPYFKNKTMEYGVEDEVTDTVIREFIKDGRLKVVAHPDDADAILEGFVSTYDISPIQRNAVGHTISYRMDITVLMSMRNLHTGDVLLPQSKFTENGIFFLSSLPGKKRQAEILTRLGEDIISRVIEGW